MTPDSLLLLRAAREVVEEEGFDQQLDDVRDRVDEIESLHRTRELTVCVPFSPVPHVNTRAQGYRSLIVFLVFVQFKDVKSGDRIRLSVDKGGALLVEDSDRPS